jgi:hypothetical protein
VSSVIAEKNAFGDELEKHVFSGRIEKKLEFLLEMCSKATAGENEVEELHQLMRDVAACCLDLLEILEDLKLPIVRPRWCDLTDAGPGVGVSNFEVKFRDAELCRVFNSDHRIRVHRSRGDSGQNEAERTNSAIGDAVVDGATIEWEKHEQFEGLSAEEKDALTVKEFEELEQRRMEQNAWNVSKQLVDRIDGAPVLSERITAYLSEEQDKLFYFNQKYLLEYHSVSSLEAKKMVPGASYFAKILRFFHSHYKVGELFMEFVKFGCKDDKCHFCRTWSGIPVQRIPQPVPDPMRPGHYQSVSTTPSINENGDERDVDDWQPRANIIKLFGCGELSLEKEDRLTEFSEKFMVKKEYVRSYVQHLTNLQIAKNIRQKERSTAQARRKEKGYEEYDWMGLVLKGELGKLTVLELNKYLTKHNLKMKGRKSEKISAITADVLRRNQPNVIETALRRVEPSVEEEEGEEEESDEDLVIGEIEADSTCDSGSEEENEMSMDGPLPLVVRTRYGRYAGHWNLFKLI